ncbi:hypothetical protein KRZ98_06415 [Sphingobium sp. AS12]|uniref:hypothetical protein n=1 Tax=Sphingobium sp. AS12 TaxID=2849495 RepID=UPI001C3139E2|nr:hypothetical protein [Sphingobium sp. AS12]MBV2147924.1 hypothetical protein [Sphingobium sp. AS12]
MRLTQICKLTLYACLATSFSTATIAKADSLKDLVDKLPAASLNSNKSTEALEYCIGVGIGDWLIPGTLRGERKLLIWGSPNAPFSNAIYTLVRIDDEGQQRSIAFRSHKAWDEKTAALIQSCL